MTHKTPDEVVIRLLRDHLTDVENTMLDMLFEIGRLRLDKSMQEITISKLKMDLVFTQQGCYKKDNKNE